MDGMSLLTELIYLRVHSVAQGQIVKYKQTNKLGNKTNTYTQTEEKTRQ
jgi:hypothetical protein